MLDTVVETLRCANSNLSHALAWLRRDGLSAVQHGWFANLRGHLSQAGSCLHKIELTRPLPPPLQAEVSQYRDYLRELAQILPAVHGHLLAEKARLQSARERQQGLQAWVEAQQRGV